MIIPLDVTAGEAALLADVIRRASKCYAKTARRPANPGLRDLQRAKAEFLERAAAALDLIARG